MTIAFLKIVRYERNDEQQGIRQVLTDARKATSRYSRGSGKFAVCISFFARSRLGEGRGGKGGGRQNFKYYYRNVNRVMELGDALTLYQVMRRYSFSPKVTKVLDLTI